MTQENDLFKKLGISMSDGKISIDTNQTKSFFEAIKSTFDNAAKDMEGSIKKGMNDKEGAMEDVGIQVNNDKISIDLEKTKSFMNDLSQSAEGFLAEIDNTIKGIAKTKD